MLDVAMGTDHLLDVNWTRKKESSGLANVRSGREGYIELWWVPERAREHLGETVKKTVGLQKFPLIYLTRVGQSYCLTAKIQSDILCVSAKLAKFH